MAEILSLPVRIEETNTRGPIKEVVFASAAVAKRNDPAHEAFGSVISSDLFSLSAKI